jgi:hypothetical protein
MNRLKKIFTAVMAVIMLSSCSGKYDYSFLTTGANSMSTITISGGILEEPYNLGGNGINEFCAAMNMITELVVADPSEIPEDTGYELLVYTKTGHTTMHIAPPYISVGDNWYRIDDQASLNYLDVMVKVIERGNYYDLSGEDSD